MSKYYTIKSRRFKRDIDFFWSGKYVYVDFSGKSANPGVLGKQICYGGDLLGSTIVADSFEDFVNECKKWWRSYLRYTQDEYSSYDICSNKFR